MLNANFVSVFAENIFQAPVFSERIKKEEQKILDEDKDGVYFRQLNLWKSKWSDDLHPRVPKEMVDVLGWLMSAIFDRSQKSENWRKENIAIIFKKTCVSTSENYKPVRLILLPGKNQEGSPPEINPKSDRKQKVIFKVSSPT